MQIAGFFKATAVVKDGMFNHNIDGIVAEYLIPSYIIKTPEPGIKDGPATTPKVAPMTPSRPGDTTSRGV